MTKTQAPGQSAYSEGETTAGPQFAVVRRGWDQAEVGNYLERLYTELSNVAAHRDATMQQARQLTHDLAAAERQQAAARSEAARLHDQIRQLAVPPENVEAMSERMRWMLALARDESEEIRRGAAARAAEIVARAEEMRVRHELGRIELESERATIESSREQLLAAAQDEANRVRREAADEQARLDAESVARRGKIEDGFAAAMAARRSEVLATLAKTDASSREAADRRRAEAAEHARLLLARASEEARRRIAGVELNLTQLLSKQRQVEEQLGAAHTALGQVLHRVDPPAEVEPAMQDQPEPPAEAPSAPHAIATSRGPVPRPTPQPRQAVAG